MHGEAESVDIECALHSNRVDGHGSPGNSSCDGDMVVLCARGNNGKESAPFRARSGFWHVGPAREEHRILIMFIMIRARVHCNSRGSEPMSLEVKLTFLGSAGANGGTG